MCFVSISEQTAMLSLYSINWLVFITVTGSVYCAVRTGSLYIIQGDSFSFRLLPVSPANITLQCPILTFIYTLLLPDGQMGEAWETSKNQSPSGNRWAMERKVLSLSLQNVSKPSLQEGRAGTILGPTEQYNFLVFPVIIAMYCLSLYRQLVSYFSPSSPPSSLSLRAVYSNVRMPSNLTTPNQCSRFSSGSILDRVLQFFSRTVFLISTLISFSSNFQA